MVNVISIYELRGTHDATGHTERLDAFLDYNLALKVCNTLKEESVRCDSDHPILLRYGRYTTYSLRVEGAVKKEVTYEDILRESEDIVKDIQDEKKRLAEEHDQT